MAGLPDCNCSIQFCNPAILPSQNVMVSYGNGVPDPDLYSGAGLAPWRRQRSLSWTAAFKLDGRGLGRTRILIGAYPRRGLRTPRPRSRRVPKLGRTDGIRYLIQLHLQTPSAGWALPSGVQVVAYDQDNGMIREPAVVDAALARTRRGRGARWRVCEMDGGRARRLEPGQKRAARGRSRPRCVPTWSVDAARVDALRADKAWRLVDARAPERYRGEVEPIDRVAGHIPGAANHCFQTNLADDGSFRSPEELRAHMRGALGDSSPDHVVCYCGSGVTACQNLLALEHAGLHRREAVRRIVERVVERSATPG